MTDEQERSTLAQPYHPNKKNKKNDKIMQRAVY